MSNPRKSETHATGHPRLSTRKKMVVPVRIFAEDARGNQTVFLAHTLDASAAGARFGGFHGDLNIGQKVIVQYQHLRSVFRVVWIGKRSTPQATQIGLASLDGGKDIWKLNLAANEESSRLGTSERPSRVMQQRWAIQIGF